MSRSELIRTLLSLFPALKPKEIERLLGDCGVSVDANLIGVARLRYRDRHDKKVELALCRLLGKLLEKCPDLLETLQAFSFQDLTQRICDIVAAHPGLAEDELAEVLAAQLPPVNTVSTRVSKIFVRVLEQQPQYRRSFELVSGVKPESVQGVVVHGEGLTDDLTDEQIEAVVLKYLDERYPAGPTAEAIARAYMSKAKEQFERTQAEHRAAEATEQRRVERILAAVVERLGSGLDDRDAAFAVVQQFVADYPDWTDEEIAERLVVGLKKLLTPPKVQPKVVPDITSLTIRKRP